MIPSDTETVFEGLPISGGVGLARVCLFNQHRHSNQPIYKVEGDGLLRQHARVKRAVSIVADRLDALRRDVAQTLGAAEAEIFSAQRMIVEDASLLDEINTTIDRRQCNAEAATDTVFRAYENRLMELEDSYLRSRASDIGEVRKRLLDALGHMNPSLQCAGTAQCQQGRNRVIVTDELTPQVTMELDTAHTVAFVTERGGVNSHAAILARALGIPAVSGISGIHSKVACNTPILVDGNNGTVVVYPTDATIADARRSRRAVTPVLQREPVRSGLRILASINRSENITEALTVDAEGIGLYRTEFEFLAAGRILTEHEQTVLYTRVAQGMGRKPVYIRLLDVGGDKGLPGLQLPEEKNPNLGFRGARFLVARPHLLLPQARALAKTSAQLGKRLHVMVPMVTGLSQFQKVCDMIRSAAEPFSGADLRLGIMFEVPAACLAAGELLEAADFASVGTNDLVQYLFAVDRDNEHVAHDYVPDHPVFWRLLQDLVDAAREHGKPLAVCGELAGDPAFIPQLVDIGVETVSVSPRLIPTVRQAAADCD